MGYRTKILCSLVAGTGMTVKVKTGRAIIQNKWVKNDAELTLNITAASSTLPRITAVIIKLNDNNRTITITTKDGEYASSPVAPSMTREGGIYEMALAYVNVAANATSVTVTDKRSDTGVCGWAAVAQAIDGTYEALIDDIKTGFDGVLYSTPGDAVRECDQKLQDQINGMGDSLAEALDALKTSDSPELIDVDFVTNSGFIGIYGDIQSDISSNYTKINVTAGEKYYVSCHLSGNRAIAFYNGTSLLSAQTASSLGLDTLVDYEFTMPPNCTVFGVTTYVPASYPLKIKQYKDVFIKSSDILSELNITSDLASNVPFAVANETALNKSVILGNSSEWSSGYYTIAGVFVSSSGYKNSGIISV